MRRAHLVFLALAACGKVSSLADARTGDGNGLDATGADASVDVSVTVLDPSSGVPVSGVPVVFTDTSGNALGHPTTGTDGTATLAMPGGGSITAVVPNGATEYDMQTVLGVKAGDAITVNQPPEDMTSSSYTVALTPYPNAFAYYVYGPCGGVETQTTSTTLMIYGYCQVTSMDLVAVAYDGNFDPLAYVERSAVPYTAGGSTSLPTTWQDLQGFTATATNVSSDITNVDVARFWPDELGYSDDETATITGTGASASLLGPTSLTAVVQTSLRHSDAAIQRVRQRNAGTSTAYNVDVGNNLMAWLGRPTLDPTSGMISTPMTAAGSTTPDLFATFVEYQRTTGNTTTRYTWIVYAPNVVDVTLPALPAEVGMVNPQAGDVIETGSSQSILVEYDSVSGYDAARQNPTAVINEFFGDEGRGPATARISESPLNLK